MYGITWGLSFILFYFLLLCCLCKRWWFLYSRYCCSITPGILIFIWINMALGFISKFRMKNRKQNWGSERKRKKKYRKTYFHIHIKAIYTRNRYYVAPPLAYWTEIYFIVIVLCYILLYRYQFHVFHNSDFRNFFCFVFWFFSFFIPWEKMASSPNHLFKPFGEMCTQC